MQVDGPHVEQGVNLLHYFETSPESFPWRAQIPHQIETRRSLLSDLLFFDILLSSGGIRVPSSLYPPSDIPSLRNLLEAIENSNYDSLKQNCLVYFLLKWHQDGRETNFADERCIPPQFSALSDAYWHLDTGIDVPTAVSILSDARLNRDYASKILEVISLTENPAPLILRYVRTSQPLLTEPNDIDKYAMALAETSFIDSWQYQRTFSEESETRPRLLRKIFDWCLSPKPRPRPLRQLLAHPLSAFEQSLLHAYALNPPRNIPAASIPVIHDLVCVRLINSGQYAAAIKLDRQFTVTGSRATEKSQKSTQERRHMMDEILATLPSVERQLLESEMSQAAQGKETASLSRSTTAESWINVGNSGINDLSMSWEHVRPNTSVLPRTTSFTGTLPISERAGAPRFGGSVLSRATSDASFAGHPTFPPHATNNSPIPPLTVSMSTPVEPSGVLTQPSFRFATTHPVDSMSLFDSFGSANQARNAFYDPPPIAGVKRPFAQDRPHQDAPSHSVHESEMIEDVDIQMHSDDDNHPEAAPIADVSQTDDEPSSHFSFSVFGTSSVNGVKPGPSKTDAKPKMPPGAFMPESEDEQEPETMVNGRFSISASPPPSRPHSPPARKSRTHGANKREKKDLSQSIPGSLFHGDTEDEEDAVAPLPTLRPLRKTRAATKKKVVEEQEGSQKPIRRSSRLSTASSRGSPSPEESPQKVRLRKSTRTSGAAATSTKSSGRKKR